MDESNPPIRDPSRYTVTITDPVTNLPVVLVLKPPKDSDSNGSRKALIPKTLEDVIGVFTGGPNGRRKDDGGHSEEIYKLFAGFVRSMLRYDPTQRSSAAQALLHPYVSANIDFPVAQGYQSSNTSNSSATSQLPPPPPVSNVTSTGVTNQNIPQEQRTSYQSRSAFPRRRYVSLCVDRCVYDCKY